ncbi:MAG: hypothetical protein MK003_13885, partial [Pseudomonadales bacterium]|nr:hypothetical protein [Pseudomonadales bacterium]
RNVQEAPIWDEVGIGNHQSGSDCEPFRLGKPGELNMYHHAFITVLSGGWITESSIFFARVIRRYNSSVSTICSTS